MRESMAVLVVIVHPEKTSFTHSWAKESIKAAKMLGHQVCISDIYQMGFDPMEKAVHYNKTCPENQFDILKTQEFHSRQNTLPADIKEEISKFSLSMLYESQRPPKSLLESSISPLLIPLFSRTSRVRIAFS